MSHNGYLRLLRRTLSPGEQVQVIKRSRASIVKKTASSWFLLLLLSFAELILLEASSELPSAGSAAVGHP